MAQSNMPIRTGTMASEDDFNPGEDTSEVRVSNDHSDRLCSLRI